MPVENNMKPQKNDSDYLWIIIRGMILFLVVMAVLFLAAGRIDYWQGWVLFGLLVIRIVVGFKLIPHRVELVRERAKPGPGIKRWDKIIRLFMAPAGIAMLLIAPLDAGRYHWSGSLPAVVYVVSYIVFSVSLIAGVWVVRANRFFSSVVRIQTDRGHEVVQSGPYRYVRHPGYAGMILGMPFLPLMLGSLWALIPAGIMIILVIIRTYLEDNMLQQELNGYKEYAEKVKYMLIPGIW